MINKSFEIIKKTSSFLNYKLFLIYGENNGLKKDIIESLKNTIKQKNENIEILSLDESKIIENDNNFFNSIYSGSLFSKMKIITISDASDKILEKIKDIAEKYPENTYIVLLSNILEKKSKLRNFF